MNDVWNLKLWWLNTNYGESSSLKLILELWENSNYLDSFWKYFLQNNNNNNTYYYYYYYYLIFIMWIFLGWSNSPRLHFKISIHYLFYKKNKLHGRKLISEELCVRIWKKIVLHYIRLLLESYARKFNLFQFIFLKCEVLMYHYGITKWLHLPRGKDVKYFWISFNLI